MNEICKPVFSFSVDFRYLFSMKNRSEGGIFFEEKQKVD